MTRPLAALGPLASLLLGACAGMFLEPPSDCAALCQLAHDCGFLPSALGHGDTPARALADCERLCAGSPADTAGARVLADCLRVTGETGWCDDPESDDYGLGMQCSGAADCLDRAFPAGNVRGAVDLDVTIVTFDDFTATYGDAALAALYADADADADVAVELMAPFAACTPALCSMSSCGGQDDAANPCDPSFCGKGMFQVGKTCEDLGATTVDVLAMQFKVPVASKVLLENSEGASCKTASAVFDAAYNLQPGPVRTYARVAGTLPAGELRRIDYPDLPDDDAAAVDYCLRFTGMSVQARAGDNLVLVPVGDVEAIETYLTGDQRPRPCME